MRQGMDPIRLESAMKSSFTHALAALLALPACAAHVTHPTKTTAEMQVDIDLCTREANHRYWMDPIAALYNAYDCLEAKGYQRDGAELTTKVDEAMGGKAARAKEPARPCRVPCTGR
jgi:hypothetical protein